MRKPVISNGISSKFEESMIGFGSYMGFLAYHVLDYSSKPVQTRDKLLSIPIGSFSVDILDSVERTELIKYLYRENPPKKGTRKYEMLHALFNLYMDEFKADEFECTLQGQSYYNGKKVRVGHIEHTLDYTQKTSAMLKKDYPEFSMNAPSLTGYKYKWKGYCLFDAEKFHLVKGEILFDTSIYGKLTKGYQLISAKIK